MTVSEHNLEEGEWTVSIYMHVYNVTFVLSNWLVYRHNKFLNHDILWKLAIKLNNVMQ